MAPITCVYKMLRTLPPWGVTVCMNHTKALLSPAAKEPASIPLAQPFQKSFEHEILTNMTSMGDIPEVVTGNTGLGN